MVKLNQIKSKSKFLYVRPNHIYAVGFGLKFNFAIFKKYVCVYLPKYHIPIDYHSTSSGELWFMNIGSLVVTPVVCLLFI